MKKIIKKPIVIIAILIIIGGGYFWYSKSKATTTAVTYKTAMAEKGTLLVSVIGTGQIEAQSQVDLKPVVAGDAIDVIQVYVKNDQAVKKGQMIALLDNADALKSVRNAELDLDSANNRYKQIKDSDTSTKYDKNAQKITIEQKENSLTDAKEKINDYYIRAPFDGIVTGLSVESGDSVSRSDILATVITKNIVAKITLNEVDAVGVRVSDKATLKVDALSEVSFTGKVSKIDTIGTVSQGVTSYGAEIELDQQNDLLKPGMNVSASITTDSKADVLLIPSGAIKSQNGNFYVQIMNGENPENRNVELGIYSSTQTEIVSGIKEGDKVVTQTIDASAKSNTSNSNSMRVPGMGGFR